MLEEGIHLSAVTKFIVDTTPGDDDTTPSSSGGNFVALVIQERSSPQHQAISGESPSQTVNSCLWVLMELPSTLRTTEPHGPQGILEQQTISGMSSMQIHLHTCPPIYLFR